MMNIFLLLYQENTLKPGYHREKKMYVTLFFHNFIASPFRLKFAPLRHSITRIRYVYLSKLTT